MAELIFKDGTTKFVTYNVAAKIGLIKQGKTVIDEDLSKLKRLANKTSAIDYKKLEGK